MTDDYNIVTIHIYGWDLKTRNMRYMSYSDIVPFDTKLSVAYDAALTKHRNSMCIVHFDIYHLCVTYEHVCENKKLRGKTVIFPDVNYFVKYIEGVNNV